MWYCGVPKRESGEAIWQHQNGVSVHVPLPGAVRAVHHRAGADILGAEPDQLQYDGNARHHRHHQFQAADFGRQGVSHRPEKHPAVRGDFRPDLLFCLLHHGVAHQQPEKAAQCVLPGLLRPLHHERGGHEHRLALFFLLRLLRTYQQRAHPHGADFRAYQMDAGSPVHIGRGGVYLHLDGHGHRVPYLSGRPAGAQRGNL